MYIRAVPAAVIERGQEQGEFSSTVDPGVAAELLTSVYFGTVSRWLSDGPPRLTWRGLSPSDLSWCWPDCRSVDAA